MPEPVRAAHRIFISYRRDDSAYAAGWLFDRLVDEFGPEQVFKDVDSIALGDDFVDAITAAVSSMDVLLALIGDKWLGMVDEHGERRLDDPDDFVRLEIEAHWSAMFVSSRSWSRGPGCLEAKSFHRAWPRSPAGRRLS